MFIFKHNKWIIQLDYKSNELTISETKNNKSVDAFIGILPNGNYDVSVGTIPGNSGWVKLSRTYIPANYQVDKYQSNIIYLFVYILYIHMLYIYV